MSTGVKRAMSDQENQQPEAGTSAARQAVDRGARDRGRRRHRHQPRHQEASINMNELRELIGLITDNGLTDFELEREDFHVKIGRNLYPELAPSASALPESVDKASGAVTQTGSAVQSIPTTAPRHPGAQAEEAARQAEAAEKAARDLALEAEKQAARDARYAARKAKKRNKR